jgi:hypothetical protein
MLRPIALALAGAAALALTGCGPNCQTTCNRLYSTTGESCGDILQRPGTSSSSLINTCLEACNDALATPGEVGGYNPNERTTLKPEFLLTNDKRAALWMDCVAGTSCEAMNNGYCEPIW